MKEELIYKAAELVVMIISILIARYFIPWLKQRTEDEKVQTIIGWVEYAVLWAEQVHHEKDGAARKKLVLEFIEDMAEKAGIGLNVLSTEQLEILIEAAVRTMNIEMGKYDVPVEQYTVNNIQADSED